MSAFSSFALDDRPLDEMTPAQIGLVLGLVPILEAAGLVLTCPRCAAEGKGTLQADNHPEDPIWKIDCQCRRRRAARTSARMTTSGELLAMVPDVLGPLSLDVRCPSPACLLKPLDVRQTADGWLATCHCGGIFRFRKTSKTTKPH